MLQVLQISAPNDRKWHYCSNNALTNLPPDPNRGVENLRYEPVKKGTQDRNCEQCPHQLHPLVPPQVLHFMQVPFLTRV